MGLFDIFRSSKGAARTDPIDTVVQPVDPLVIGPVNILGGRLKDVKDLRLQNRYALADALYNGDDRLFSAIELMALMIEKSIGDVSIIGVRQDDKELSNEEINAIGEANKFAKMINLKHLFYNYTKDLWKYGDAVDVIHFNSSGITELEPLPMGDVTAVDNRDQIGKPIGYNQPMIRKPKYYVLDENMSTTDVKFQVFKKERILHISFDPRRNQIRDNLTRWTINVWSVAPINSLIAILQWKQILIRNNILTSNRNVPRELHVLDLGQFDASKEAGTMAERRLAAKTAAETAIKNYNDTIKFREADQGYVVGKGTDIKFIEPASKANDPNLLIDQINQSIGGPMGAPAGLMGGESKGFTSLIHASSFLALRAENYAGVIQRPLEELVKRHVRLARPGIRKSVIERLYIKNRLILDRDRSELAKVIAVLVESGSFTLDEIRKIFGMDPMTEKEMKEHIKWLQAIKKTSNVTSGKRSDDMLRRDQTSPTEGQESQGKRDKDLIQKGDKD